MCEYVMTPSSAWIPGTIRMLASDDFLVSTEITDPKPKERETRGPTSTDVWLYSALPGHQECEYIKDSTCFRILQRPLVVSKFYYWTCLQVMIGANWYDGFIILTRLVVCSLIRLAVMSWSFWTYDICYSALVLIPWLHGRNNYIISECTRSDVIICSHFITINYHWNILQLVMEDDIRELCLASYVRTQYETFNYSRCMIEMS